MRAIRPRDVDRFAWAVGARTDAEVLACIEQCQQEATAIAEQLRPLERVMEDAMPRTSEADQVLCCARNDLDSFVWILEPLRSMAEEHRRGDR